MDFEPVAHDDPRRVAIRDWLTANPEPTGAQLAEAGYVAPHLPKPYGLAADAMHQLIIDEELKRANVKLPENQIGIGWAAPTILDSGTPEQQERYIPKILSGEETWCQMFSEPDAGSDLANLSTRAVRDGDEYIVNGSKIWTSGGHNSQFGILIARTDPDVPKHRGVSYFICPTDLPGLTMTPIIDMTTAHSFNQVFFDDVRLPVENRIGEEGDGWRLAKVTLSNERVQLSSGGALWGSGPSLHHLLDLVKQNGGITDPSLRQQLMHVYSEAEVLRLTRLRTLSAQLAGQAPGPEASIQKLIADEHGQHIMEMAKAITGAHGMLAGSGPVGDLPDHATGGATEINFDRDLFTDVDSVWHYGWLFSPALTLGGGTFAIQRNIVAEHVLGLPRDIHPDKGKPWAQTVGAGATEG